LENASGTQNLGGTYSTERMYLNDSYTLTGDVTITGHLALGTVADSDVVITNDSSARTITGSGTIESGRLMNDWQSSLTGMTGELGSAVTNNAGVASGVIASGVTGGAGLSPVQPISFTVGHTSFGGGLAWFDTVADYYGVDCDYVFTAGQVITRFKIREGNTVDNCDIWFLVWEQSSTSSAKYYIAAGWKFNSQNADAGNVQEFHVANAKTTVGNVLSNNGFQIPSTSFGTNGTGTYYLGVLGSDDRKNGDKNSAIYADANSGGQVDYVSSGQAGFNGYPDAITLATAEITMDQENSGSKFHINASG